MRVAGLLLNNLVTHTRYLLVLCIILMKCQQQTTGHALNGALGLGQPGCGPACASPQALGSQVLATSQNESLAVQEDVYFQEHTWKNDWPGGEGRRGQGLSYKLKARVASQMISTAEHPTDGPGACCPQKGDLGPCADIEVRATGVT